MKRIHLAKDIKPLSEFRANAASLIKQVREDKRVLVLTQRGQSSVVLLDVYEYERLLEDLETLRDIHLAEKQIAQGEGLSHEKARKKVLSELHK
ncbi:type II toxin-antitoxin system Phd/YefM family antitoxin [Acidobacteria bacterium AH-259-L09]|nr:type II toxin-antitoxin system Phd/YefM family antitoxin [Acidobacteria bacterium AH-259-L09]